MLHIIKNAYPQLTNAERRVADIILENPLDACKSSAKEISCAAGVAPSAVIRFCKSVGADGFSELKERLLDELSQKDVIRQNTSLPISDSDDTEGIFEKVFFQSKKTLTDTFKMFDFDDISQILEMINSSKRVVFFGVGTSSVVCIDAHYRFSQLGISSSYCSDILFMNVTAANLEKDDLAVFISHSGQTKATVDAMKNAKKVGAKTLSITSFSQSILARECQKSIIAFSDMQTYPVEAVSARLAHMCIIDALMMSLAKTKQNELKKYMDARNCALGSIRY
jgi:DNA-binding MurR/RpiR family transcriptional regulator